MNRRTFISALAGLPIIGRFLPAATVAPSAIAVVDDWDFEAFSQEWWKHKIAKAEQSDLSPYWKHYEIEAYRSRMNGETDEEFARRMRLNEVSDDPYGAGFHKRKFRTTYGNGTSRVNGLI